MYVQDWQDEVEWTAWYDCKTLKHVWVPMSESESAAYVAAVMLGTKNDVCIDWDPDPNGMVYTHVYDSDGYWRGATNYRDPSISRRDYDEQGYYRGGLNRPACDRCGREYAMWRGPEGVDENLCYVCWNRHLRDQETGRQSKPIKRRNMR